MKVSDSRRKLEQGVVAAGVAATLTEEAGLADPGVVVVGVRDTALGVVALRVGKSNQEYSISINNNKSNAHAADRCDGLRQRPATTYMNKKIP